MRIVSKFRDYYDGVQRHGQDLSIVYVRKTQTIPVKESSRWTGWGIPVLRIDWTTIGFCGSIHCLANASVENVEPAVCLSIEDVDKFIKDRLKPWCWDEWNEPHYRKHQNLGVCRKEVANLWEKAVERSADRAKEFDRYKAPVLIWKSNPDLSASASLRVLEVNGKLADTGFPKIKNPYEAFHEIERWLSNQAVPLKPIPVIDDVTLCEAKGFNKFSFRKDPAKKK